MLKVSDLCFDYQDKPLLDQVQFDIKSGQILHLRGKNGAGKTTLLKLLVGLIEPHEGSIIFNGQSIHDNLPHYQQQLAYVGHKSGLSSQLTIRENYLFGIEKNVLSGHLERYLSDLDLLSLADTYCSKLSLGQRRRASLLRLRMSSAKLWLLDEPLSALDQKAIEIFITWIAAHLTQGGAVIMTSHQAFPKTPFLMHEYVL